MKFTFDNDYKNTEQVRPYMADFLEVYAEFEAAGKFPYNDSFKGRIPGVEGPDEDTAIYLLQTLRDLDLLEAKVAAFLAEGGEHVETLTETRRGTVVCYGFYMGGTGWREYPEARLVARNGKPYAILPKGKRTNGYQVEGRVMIRPQ